MISHKDLSSSSILLIGAGKMGSVLLSAWLRAGASPRSITVVEPNTDQIKALKAQDVHAVATLAEITLEPDVVVLAVKPQSMDALLPELARKFSDGHKPLYLSIAAGKTLGYFKKYLKYSAIVRAMPNTPALIGKGISALCGNDIVNADDKELVLHLLETLGDVVWLNDESLMDVVTAISGSGPAYVFLFMEALIDAATRHSLPADVARKLVVQTVCGSGELAKVSSEEISQLRQNVTSPGGTTQAALEELMSKDQLATLLEVAVRRAIKRSKELA